MGAGKSTLGPLIAERLGRPFVSVDAVVEERSGTSISDLFETRGEATFRELEEEATADVLSRHPLAVVELGGGALASERTRMLLAELALRTDDVEGAVWHATMALERLEAGEYNHACGLEALGEAMRRGANNVEAEGLFREGLVAFVKLGAGGAAADCLDGLAQLAYADGDLGRTGCLRGAADTLRREWAWRRIRNDVILPTGDDDEYARGARMTFDEAVQYALASIH